MSGGMVAAADERMRVRMLAAGVALGVGTILLLLWHSGSNMPAGDPLCAHQ